MFNSWSLKTAARLAQPRISISIPRTHDASLSNQKSPIETDVVSLVSQEHYESDEQLIFLSRGKLPQIDPYELSSDGWCEVLNFLRSAEQGFLLWISKVTTVGDLEFLERFPTDDGKVRL